MNELAQSSAPSFGYNADPPKRVLWKWSFAITAAVLAFLMWQCGSTSYSGRELANNAVRRFHTEFNSGEYDEICREGVEGLSERESMVSFCTFWN
jgi:hypothetical protein